MKDGPVIASLAALIGDPGRANMLSALMDGRALTVSELADAAGVALPTASEHLQRLAAGGLVVAEKQGRHRYYRLASAHVASAIEALMNLADRTGARRVRTGPSDAALRAARVCYDHLAGTRAVALAEAFAGRGLIVGDRLTNAGHAFAAAHGLAPESGSRRPACRICLDWSERRHHLAGQLGAAILTMVLEKGWATRKPGRVVSFTRVGATAFDALFGLPFTPSANHAA